MKNYSILIPHKKTGMNDLSLEINIKMLNENSENKNFELIIMEEECNPYKLWNDYSDKAKYDNLVFSNSDVLMARRWDTHLIGHLCDNSIVTGYLVECGVILPASQNINMDFGSSASSFRRDEFESYCEEKSISTTECKNERGWYMPCSITKSLFNKMGRFSEEKPFPYPNDIDFWEKCISNGVILKRANSFAYHFQNLSNKEHEHKRN
jgi:hypothetical protein